jgi:hypothetical protein
MFVASIEEDKALKDKLTLSMCRVFTKAVSRHALCRMEELEVF